MGNMEIAFTLQDVTEIVQEIYMDTYFEVNPVLRGRMTNEIFKWGSGMVADDGITMQYELRASDAIRSSNNMIGDFTQKDRFEPGKLKIRWNPNSVSDNDFTRISGSAMTTIPDVENAIRSKTVVDLVERVVGQLKPSYENYLAILRNAPKSGLLSLVNGTPKENDNDLFSATTSTADNTDGIRFQVDAGSIGTFRPGMTIDFYDPTNETFSAQGIRITDVNFTDSSGAGGGSVGGIFVASGRNRLSSGNLADVADNDEIYFSEAKGAGMYSIGAYEETPVAGENWLGGKDRTLVDNRWLRFLRARQGEASAQISKTHFNDVAVAMTEQIEKVRNGVVSQMHPAVEQTLRDDIGADSLVTIASEDSRVKRFETFGSMGTYYQHPALGLIRLNSDTLCPGDRARLIVPKTWSALHYGHTGLQLVPGNGNMGHWYRVGAETQGAGDSLFLQQDWIAWQTDFCTNPGANTTIHNIAA